MPAPVINRLAYPIGGRIQRPSGLVTPTAWWSASQGLTLDTAGTVSAWAEGA